MTHDPEFETVMAAQLTAQTYLMSREDLMRLLRSAHACGYATGALQATRESNEQFDRLLSEGARP